MNFIHLLALKKNRKDKLFFDQHTYKKEIMIDFNILYSVGAYLDVWEIGGWLLNQFIEI